MSIALDFPVPFCANTHAPRVALPAGAVDAHMHIYDDALATSVPTARLRPPAASVEDYRRWQRVMGLQRTVVVTPSTYGLDNGATLSAVRALNAQRPDSARAVVVIDGRQSTAQLKELHAQGVRGVRLNFSQGAGVSDPNPRDINGLGLEDLQRIAQVIAPLGWHVQLLMGAGALVAAADVLRDLPAPVVFDHFGRIAPQNSARHHSGAHALVLELLGAARAWVKLSGGYIVSDAHTSADAALVALARSYLQAAPTRCIWGSDWPHATASAGQHPMPDDAQQIEALAQWCESDALQPSSQPSLLLRQVLVDNPAQLYGF